MKEYPARIIGFDCFTYKVESPTAPKAGQLLFLTPSQVTGYPDVGDEGTITYMTTSSAGWWQFKKGV